LTKKRFTAAMFAAAAVAAVATSVALADPTSSHSGGAMANQTGVVRIDRNNPQVAYVSGWYSCPTGTQAHLFVSVKQVASAKPDSRLKEEGSSGISSAWLERHFDGEPTCDGQKHSGTWRITNDQSDQDYEYGMGGPLIPGQVYVQFCWDELSLTPTWHAYSEQFARASY
jgi:hypothetical protein